MNKNIFAAAFGAALLAAACQSSTQAVLRLEELNDSIMTLTVASPTRFALLPVTESNAEVQVKLDTGDDADTYMDVRLATDADKIDYYVPFALQPGTGLVTGSAPAGAADGPAKITIHHAPGAGGSAFLTDSIRLVDELDMTNTDEFRPVYHHTPLYGWMNDANGLVYKDGEYHLYFQYNPYGSVWGNMHWGHSVSRDLMHWEHLDPAIARDTLGHIFSGSCVVDKDNTSGYGANSIIAFYTSASDKNGQITCMAHSADNGRTFTKYEKNPVIVPFDGLKDFRDPKCFWYEPEKKWVIVISADKEIRFYSSKNLKDWEYMSSFGNGYGFLPSQFECPDFVELPVDSDPANTKWLMIVNINPGCMFGGSATQYFVGSFDGTTFRCETEPDCVKWLDYGKDHYATVCFSNTPGRCIAVPWMSNWQYANIVPTQQFRSANALPRELSLYTKDGQTYVAAAPVKETEQLRGAFKALGTFDVQPEKTFNGIDVQGNGAYEITMDLIPGQADEAGLELFNADGEKVKIYVNRQAKALVPGLKTLKTPYEVHEILVMDRAASGIVELNRKQPYNVHEKETEPHSKNLSVNFKDEFALGTWAPLSLCADNGKRVQLRIFVDRCSIELFADGGRIAMTNLVFPTRPYDSIRFYSTGEGTKVENLNVYSIKY